MKCQGPGCPQALSVVGGSRDVSEMPASRCPAVGREKEGEGQSVLSNKFLHMRVQK